MIRLGDIEYSNCFPVHARLVDETTPADVALHTGVPAVLNQMLAAGEIDVAPCSSIEYARHAGQYRVLPDFVIGSDGPVQSIRFDARVSPEKLDGTVYVTDSSATSVALLRILLARYWNVTPRFETFDQSVRDPVTEGGDAALFIGDVALRRPLDSAEYAFDLGEVWKQWTGLPFAFAVWQARSDLDAANVTRIHELLCDSHAWFRQHHGRLAVKYASHFAMDAAVLDQYWASLKYDLDARMREGLLRFLALAAELGEAPPVPRIEFADVLTQPARQSGARPTTAFPGARTQD